jgi:hypothetical protein
LLDLVEDLQPGSRLSCQIMTASELDDLKVTLASGIELCHRLARMTSPGRMHIQAQEGEEPR